MIDTGTIIPLVVQLFDANLKAQINVTVFSPSSEIIFQGELQHIRNGLYETKQLVMPDMDFVIAQYEVLNSEEYSKASETFYRTKTEEITKQLLAEYSPKYDNYYTGSIVSESKDDYIEGFLNGSVETESI
jgi:hypothetical protein